MKEFNLVLKGKKESLEKIIKYCNYRFTFEKGRFLLSDLIEDAYRDNNDFYSSFWDKDVAEFMDTVPTAKGFYGINEQELEVVDDTLNVLFTNPFSNETEPVPEQQIKKLLETVDKNLSYDIAVLQYW